MASNKRSGWYRFSETAAPHEVYLLEKWRDWFTSKGVKSEIRQFAGKVKPAREGEGY